MGRKQNIYLILMFMNIERNRVSYLIEYGAKLLFLSVAISVCIMNNYWLIVLCVEAFLYIAELWGIREILTLQFAMLLRLCG